MTIIAPEDRVICTERKIAEACGWSIATFRRRKARQLAGEPGLVPKLIKLGEHKYGTTPRYIREWQDAGGQP